MTVIHCKAYTLTYNYIGNEIIELKNNEELLCKDE